MDLYKIERIVDVHNESIDKYVERNRIGKMVTNVFPIQVNFPLRLQYVGGEKDGMIFQHSTIKNIEKINYLEEIRYKIYTENTLIELKYLGFLSKAGVSGTPLTR